MNIKKMYISFLVFIATIITLNVYGQKQVATQKDKLKSDKSTMQWIEMGPCNMGGRTKTLLIDKNNINTLYSGAIASGLWKSTTGGSSWNAVESYNQNANLSVNTIYQDTNGNLYVGTGELNDMFGYTGIAGEGIWKSTDGGNTWTWLSSTNDDAFKYVTKITGVGSKLYVATAKGLRISNDGGNTWINPIPSTDPNYEQPSTDVEVSTDGSIVVASINNQAYVSNDGNDNFVLKSGTNGIPTDVIRLEFAIAPTNKNHIYCIAADNAGKFKNIYESTDAGNTWNAILTNVPSLFQPFGSSKNKDGRYACALMVDPTDENTLFIGGIDLYKYNPSTSFVQITASYLPSYAPNYVHNNIFNIIFSPNYATDNTIYVVTDGGIFKSNTKGESWTSINKNLNIGYFNSVGFSRNDEVYGGTQYNGLLFNNLMGTSNKHFEQYLGNINVGDIHRSVFNPDIWIATTSFGTIYRSSNGIAALESGVSDSITGQYLGQASEPIYAPLRVFEIFNDTNSRIKIEFYAPDKLYLGDTIKVTNGYGYNIYHIIDSTDLAGNPYIEKDDTLYIKDPFTALVAFGLNNKLWISWEALNPTKIPPAWYPVIYNTSINRIQTLEFSNDGDIIFFASYDSTTNTSYVYRVSNILAARTKALATYNSSACVISSQLIGTFSGKVNGLATDPQNKENLLVFLSSYNTNTHVYYSTNAASTTDTTTLNNFVSKQGDLPNIPVYCGIILWNNSNHVILGTEKGIYVTENINDANPSWIEQNNGMNRVPVSQIRQQLHKNGWLSIPNHIEGGIQTGVENHGVIYIATKGRGIFRCEDFRGPVSVPENTGYVASNSIQLYPNPANNNVNIKFELTNPSNVEVSIYNLNGQKFTTKNYHRLNKGTQIITLPVSNLHSGIYLVQIKSNDGTYIQKLIVE